VKKVNLISIAILLSFFSIFLIIGTKSIAKQERDIRHEEYVPNEVLVRFKRDIPRYLIQNTIDSLQGKIFTYMKEEISSFDWNPDVSSLRSFLSDPYLLHVKVPDSIGTEQAIYLLKLNPNVEHVEKNVILHLDATPNDTHFTKLWGLNNTGQTGGTSDADIDAPEAWSIFTGSSSIVVAVIDSGVDYDHDDLASNIWHNPGETGNGKETDGIDNDGNGYIDDWRGWDFVGSGDNDPMDENDQYLPYYHGTHVAGTIGAVGNNNEGVTGVNWNVKIMALRVSDNGDFPVSNAIDAIDYATNNGAHLSSNSYGWYDDDPEFEDYLGALYNAISRAKNAGKLFVTSAGNDSVNLDYKDEFGNPGTRQYPACYDLDNIITVAATDHNDSMASYSNYGLWSVDVGAPGGGGESYPDYDYKDIYSTMRYDAYQYMAGTSMACPHVAGLAALVWGYKPSLSWSTVKFVVLDSVDELGSLFQKVNSEGRINAYKALKELTPPTAPSNLSGNPTAWDVMELSWQDESDNELGFKVERRTSSSGYSEIGSVGENATAFMDCTVSGGITYYYRVKAHNLGGYNYSDEVPAEVPDDTPDAPSSLTGYFSYGSHAVELTWMDNADNELGFKIERKSEYEPWWQEIDVVGSNTTNYEDDSVDPDTFYWYRIKAYNPIGPSSASNEKRVYVPQY
jgi:subtilisin family serine protease